MNRAPHKFTESANPAAVAWTWTSDGRVHQLVWTRGPEPMIYGIKSDGSWTHIPSRHPRMMDIPNIKAARLVADWFINGHMDAEHDDAY